jgi:hypothetical protein
VSIRFRFPCPNQPWFSSRIILHLSGATASAALFLFLLPGFRGQLFIFLTPDEHDAKPHGDRAAIREV